MSHFFIQIMAPWAALFADVVQILVGLAALVISITQRHKISAAFTILFSYALRTSVSDFRHHLEKLKECKIEGGDESKEGRAALAYIAGKMNGNQTLLDALGPKLFKRIKGLIQDLDENKPVSEATKIEIYSEIKERLESLELNQTVKTSNKKD